MYTRSFFSECAWQASPTEILQSSMTAAQIVGRSTGKWHTHTPPVPSVVWSHSDYLSINLVPATAERHHSRLDHPLISEARVGRLHTLTFRPLAETHPQLPLSYPHSYRWYGGVAGHGQAEIRCYSHRRLFMGKMSSCKANPQTY